MSHLGDIGFFSNGNAVDLKIENGDLKTDDSFETVVLISLFTDRYVDQQNLPAGETDPRGWWGDAFADPVDDQIGSQLWRVLDRAKILDSTEAALEEFATEALQWLIDDGVAKTVTATATRANNERIDLAIEIVKPDGDNVPFDFVWHDQELKISEVT